MCQYRTKSFGSPGPGEGWGALIQGRERSPDDAGPQAGAQRLGDLSRGRSLLGRRHAGGTLAPRAGCLAFIEVPWHGFPSFALRSSVVTNRVAAALGFSVVLVGRSWWFSSCRCRL